MMAPNAARIMRVYRAATAEQAEAGLRWYVAAHDAAAELDPGNTRRAAGVIAALSPRTSWERNLLLARNAYERGEATGALGRSCRAANAILAGGEPLDVLSGQKVRAFFQLIADPTDNQTVCVDRHAVRVALGYDLSDRELSAIHLERNGLYGRFVDTYRRAADKLSVLPWQAQAVTWVTWRDRFRSATA